MDRACPKLERPDGSARVSVVSPLRAGLVVWTMLVAGLALAGESGHATLRGAYHGKFLVGVALGSHQIEGRQLGAGLLAAVQFSALTPENAMKWESLHPRPDRYDFAAADAFAEFASRHRMELIGHTLVWHSQTPAWVFRGVDGKPATRDELLERMRGHIRTVVGRYRGKVKGWDVVNEALADGGDGIFRDSPWRRIIGDDFIDHAFRAAREADPAAELYYNDYGLEDPRKRERCLRLIRGLQERGVPIDGIGTQSHFQLEHPSLAEVERTIVELGSTGLKVVVTELDVDVLPSRGPAGVADLGRRERAEAALDPWKGGLPDEVQQRLARRYADLFGVYLRQRRVIGRVTLWGLDDGHSWLNGFPIRGRTNHPLLFDRDLKPKPAVHRVIAAGVEPARS